MKLKSNSHYTMIVLVVCALATASMGILNSAVGVFFTPVSNALGVGRGAFSLHITIQALVGAFMTLNVSRVYNHFDFKKIISVSIGIIAFSTFMMSTASNVYAFYVLGALRGTASAFVGMYPMSIIINNWFKKKRGLVTSIVMSFTGVAGAVFSPLFTKLILSVGWHQTYRIVGGIILLLGLPIILYPFKIDPGLQGLKAYGDDEYSEDAIKAVARKDFDFKQLPFFLYAFVAVMFAGLTGIAQYLPGYAETLNYSATVGATLVSATMMGSIISKLVIGVIADKKSALMAAVTMMISTMTGIVLLFIAKPEILLYGGAFLFGAAYSLGSVATVLLTSYYFGLENYPSVFPLISFSAGVGNALMMSLIGFIYDLKKSYTPILVLGFVIYTLIFIILFLMKKIKLFNKLKTSRT